MTEKKRNLRKVHRDKPDLSENPKGLEKVISSIQPKKLYPLRINAITLILVPEEKRNEEYAKKYLKRMNGEIDEKELRYNNSVARKINIEELKIALSKGDTVKQMARQFGVSTTSISNFIKKHNLKK